MGFLGPLPVVSAKRTQKARFFKFPSKEKAALSISGRAPERDLAGRICCEVSGTTLLSLGCKNKKSKQRKNKEGICFCSNGNCNRERGCSRRPRPWPAWRPCAFQERMLGLPLQPRGAIPKQANTKRPERQLPFQSAGRASANPSLDPPTTNGYPATAVKMQSMRPSKHNFWNDENRL